MSSLLDALLPLLTDDLRRAPWRGMDNPLAGHCYVAAEVVCHVTGAKPMFVRHEGAPHWYAVLDGRVIDPTASQFSTPVPYHLGRGKGFLTKAPSRRAQRVLQSLPAGATIC